MALFTSLSADDPRLRHGTRICQEQRTCTFSNSFVCDKEPEYAKSFVSADESSEGTSRIWVSDVSRVSPNVTMDMTKVFLIGIWSNFYEWTFVQPQLHHICPSNIGI